MKAGYRLRRLSPIGNEPKIACYFSFLCAFSSFPEILFVFVRVHSRLIIRLAAVVFYRD